MPHLTQLSVNLCGVLHDELLLEPFSNLTHLGILEFTSNGRPWEGRWEVLTHLPKLTHICMSFHIRLDVISKALLLCPILEVVIAMPVNNRHTLDLVDDYRFVLLEFLNDDDFMHDWEKGANGGVDIWFFCELIVFARRSE